MTRATEGRAHDRQAGAAEPTGVTGDVHASGVRTGETPSGSIDAVSVTDGRSADDASVEPAASVGSGARTGTDAPTGTGEATGGRKPFPFRFIFPLMWGAALNPINSSLVATSLVAIGLAFGVSAGQTAILVAAVYVSSAVAQPTMGKLAAQFGPRRVFIAGMAIVVLAGIVGTFVPGFGWLIVSRVLAGIGTSAGNPTAMMMIRSRADRLGTGIPGTVLGMMSIAAQVTAALGLPLGGVLVGIWDWRAVFAINIPLGLIGIVMTLIWIPRDEPRVRSERHGRGLLSALDPAGLTLFAVTITSVIFFLQSIPNTQWWLLALALGALAGLIVWERRAAHPFIDVRMLARNGPLVRTYGRQAITQAAMYMVLYGYVQWLEEGRGLAASVSGLIMLPMTAVGAVGSALISRRALVRWPLIGSAVAVTVGGAMLSLVNGDTPIVLLVGLSLLFGAVTGLTGVSNQAAMYSQTDAAGIGVAAGLLRTSTYLGAIAASAIIGLTFTQRATDAGLHSVSLVIICLGVAGLLLVTLDRAVPRRAH